VSRLLPPSTNAQYAGSPGAPRILAALAVLTILPACIHSFLPDGLDMAACRQLVVALFHWAGATQLVFGIVMLLAAMRYRSFVPLVLLLLLVERGLHALHFWGGAAPQSGHRPPEHYALLVALPLIAYALRLSLRDRA
jgi:hypothetical protein